MRNNGEPNVNKPAPSKMTYRAAWLLVFLVVGRFVWLYQNDLLIFTSELSALVPAQDKSALWQQVESRSSQRTQNKIIIAVQGSSLSEADAATDRLDELIYQGIERKKFFGAVADGLNLDLLAARITAMTRYKDRLIADSSRRRMLDDFTAQLTWRQNEVTRFPPSYITEPVKDPLGTLEEFLQERILATPEIISDGSYLRVKDSATNVLLVELTKDGVGVARTQESVNWLSAAIDTVRRELGVKVYPSGFQIHATLIRANTSAEVKWMVALATLFTFILFVACTRSPASVVITFISIVIAVMGGLVVSEAIVGLPHLIGLVMATTAIGICIDFSLHFWVYVRSGAGGARAIRIIRRGLNICLLTTGMGLLAIALTNIPILEQTSIFILGSLLTSWVIVMFIVPRMSSKQRARPPRRLMNIALSRRTSVAAMLIIATLSVTGLSINYYTDDSPIRLGNLDRRQLENDRVVRKMLKINNEPMTFIIKGDSAESMIDAEAKMLDTLSAEELAPLRAISRMVVPIERQQRNRSLYDEARKNLDAERLEKYTRILNVPELDWESESGEYYSLAWVLAQPWAEAERELVYDCDDSLCVGAIQTDGKISRKLRVACERVSECTPLAIAEQKVEAFQELRSSMVYALFITSMAIFSVLFFYFRIRAIGMMATPALSALSGVAVMAWLGMPITVFTLAAIFLLLGLSVDYVVFAVSARRRDSPTYQAIAASALTTSVTFIILSFSATPAVQFFALPIAVGILVAWVSVQAFRVENV